MFESPLHLVLLCSLAVHIGCGSSTSDDTTDQPRPVEACDPRPAEEVEDCAIAGPLNVTNSRQLRAVCEATCSRVDGALLISNLPGLEDLRAFSNIRAASSLDVLDMPDLKSLDGLENLSSTLSFLFIETNPQLESIEGLSGITRLAGGLRGASIGISDNPKLASLRGLDNLEVVESREESSIIRNNASLRNLEGLGSLRRFSVALMIQSNANLESLDGLDSLEQLGGLGLRGNPRLTKLVGSAPKLETMDFGIEIIGNTQLPPCEIEQFIADIEEPGQTEVSDNGPACN